MSKHIVVASIIALGGLAGLASLGGCAASDLQQESTGEASAAISTNTCSCGNHNNTWDGPPWGPTSTFLGATEMNIGPTYGPVQWTVDSCKTFCRGKAVDDGMGLCATYPTADFIEMQGSGWVYPNKGGTVYASWYESIPCPLNGSSSSGGSSSSSGGSSSSSGGSSSGGGGHNMECFLSYNACAAVCGGVCEHRVNCGGPSAHKCFE